MPISSLRHMHLRIRDKSKQVMLHRILLKIYDQRRSSLFMSRIDYVGAAATFWKTFPVEQMNLFDSFHFSIQLSLYVH